MPNKSVRIPPYKCTGFGETIFTTIYDNRGFEITVPYNNMVFTDYTWKNKLVKGLEELYEAPLMYTLPLAKTLIQYADLDEVEEFEMFFFPTPRWSTPNTLLRVPRAIYGVPGGSFITWTRALLTEMSDDLNRLGIFATLQPYDQFFQRAYGIGTLSDWLPYEDLIIHVADSDIPILSAYDTIVMDPDKYIGGQILKFVGEGYYIDEPYNSDRRSADVKDLKTYIDNFDKVRIHFMPKASDTLSVAEAEATVAEMDDPRVTIQVVTGWWGTAESKTEIQRVITEFYDVEVNQ